MMMMMRELVSILLHTRIQTRARLQEESKSSESTTESQNRKFPARRAMMMNKERKTTTPRAHNPSREGSNAIIKHISVQFNHFHPYLNDRSTRTARISNPKSHETHKKRASLRPIFYIGGQNREERFWQAMRERKTHTRTLKRNVLSSFAPRLEFTARGASLVERVATDTHCYL